MFVVYVIHWKFLSHIQVKESGKSSDYLKIMAVVSLRAWSGNWKKQRVGRVLECRVGDSEFHPWERTNAQGLKITEKWTQWQGIFFSLQTARPSCGCKWLCNYGGPFSSQDVKIVSSIRNFVLNTLTLKVSYFLPQTCVPIAYWLGTLQLMRDMSTFFLAKRGPSPNGSEVDSFHVAQRQTQCNL